MLTFTSPSEPFFFSGKGKGRAPAATTLTASHFNTGFEIVEPPKPNGRRNFATYTVTDHLTHHYYADENDGKLSGKSAGTTTDDQGGDSAATNDAEIAANARRYSTNASSDVLAQNEPVDAKVVTGKKTSGYTQIGHFSGGDCVLTDEPRRPSRRILQAPTHFDGFSAAEDIGKPAKKKGEFSRARNESHFLEGFSAEDTDIKSSGRKHTDAKPGADHFHPGFVADDPTKPTGRARPDTHARGTNIGSGLVPTGERTSPKKGVSSSRSDNLQTSLVPTDIAEHVKPGKGRAPADTVVTNQVVLGGCLPLEDERIPKWKINAMKARGEDPSQFISGPAVNDVFSPWKAGRPSDAKRAESPLRGVRYQARPNDNPNILTWQ